MFKKNIILIFALLSLGSANKEEKELSNFLFENYDKTTRPIKINKTDKIDKSNKTDKLFDRIYELFILILLAILISLMCETIVRIAKN